MLQLGGGNLAPDVLFTLLPQNRLELTKAFVTFPE